MNILHVFNHNNTRTIGGKNMNIDKELEVIYDLRNLLIGLYPEDSDTEKYIIASELLTDLETLVRDRKDEDEDDMITEDTKTKED
jgi:hypothetical protein